MFELQTPWWELVARAAILYVLLFILLRITGKRAIGQFSPFDLIVMLLLAQAVAGALTAGDESISGAIILAVTLLALNVLTDVATSYSRKAEQLLEGHEILLGRNGRIFDDVLRSNLITRSAVEAAMRQADVPLEEVDTIILEADGTISVLRKKK
jgi:uncharacterized membrane protein YcaP (DUF421 family)